jgi:hypothetical protein
MDVRLQDFIYIHIFFDKGYFNTRHPILSFTIGELISQNFLKLVRLALVDEFVPDRATIAAYIDLQNLGEATNLFILNQKVEYIASIGKPLIDYIHVEERHSSG